MALRRGGADLALRLRAGATALQAQPASMGAAFNVSRSNVGSFEPEGARHASMQAVKMRMKSVENISKITKAMKLVAASRLRGVQEKTLQSRAYPTPLLKIFGDTPSLKVDEACLVPVTSDKGLCGGINSTVSKYTKVMMQFSGNYADNTRLYLVGEKGRSQLMRGVTSEAVAGVVLDTSKNGITYSQAGEIADDISAAGFDKVQVLFNRFRSAISFKPTLVTILTPDSHNATFDEENKCTFDEYELEGPIKSELMRDLYEFNLGSTLYYAMLENSCSELGSRMQAMENSTKNAGDMLQKLTLYYNRTRQAKITTELIEIISGAEALEQMN